MLRAEAFGDLLALFLLSRCPNSKILSAKAFGNPLAPTHSHVAPNSTVRSAEDGNPMAPTHSHVAPNSKVRSAAVLGNLLAPIRRFGRLEVLSLDKSLLARPLNTREAEATQGLWPLLIL